MSDIKEKKLSDDVLEKVNGGTGNGYNIGQYYMFEWYDGVRKDPTFGEFADHTGYFFATYYGTFYNILDHTYYFRLKDIRVDTGYAPPTNKKDSSGCYLIEKSLFILD